MKLELGISQGVMAKFGSKSTYLWKPFTWRLRCFYIFIYFLNNDLTIFQKSLYLSNITSSVMSIYLSRLKHCEGTTFKEENLADGFNEGEVLSERRGAHTS